MTLEEKIAEYKKNFDVLNDIDLDQLHTLKIYQHDNWIQQVL